MVIRGRFPLANLIKIEPTPKRSKKSSSPLLRHQAIVVSHLGNPLPVTQGPCGSTEAMLVTIMAVGLYAM